MRDALGTGTISGAEALVEALRELGVEVVFGLPGVHNLPIWRVLDQAPVRLIGVRHEQTAVYAADGYARATGRLGVAIVTTGPGAANTLGATGEAWASGSPVLVIATDIPSGLRRPGSYRGVLHEVTDQAALFAPVVKAALTIAPGDDIAVHIRHGAQTACAAPTRPVYVGVPTDLLTAPNGSRRPPAPAQGPGSGGDTLDAAVALVEDARSPLIWCGGGALRSGAGESVAALAETLGAPVLTTYQARGLIGATHPCAAPGPVHAPEVGVLWDDADLVIAVGTDFDGMMTQNWSMPAPDRLLAINIDAAEAGKNYRPDVALIGDADPVVRELTARLAKRDGMAALGARLEPIARALRMSIEDDDAEAARFLDAMRDLVPHDATIVADMCIPGYWLGAFHQVPAPRRFAYPVGWGTLGFGFPAAVGAALAGPARAVAVCGDGGFLFACGELATVVQEQLDLTIVLVDDGGYGMLRFDQVHAGDPAFGVDLLRPDFAALAQAFGLPVARVAGFGPAFSRELERSLADPGPSMVVVDAGLKPPVTTSPRWYRRAPVA